MTEIILGPPGTGKTTSLINEVDAELKRGTLPNQIAYVSFTKRAAAEAVHRACDKFGFIPDDLPYFRTLHSLCFRTLGMQRGDVFEGKVVQEWAKYAGVRVTGHWSDDGTLTGYMDGDRILFIDNMSRVRCVHLQDQYNEDPDNKMSWTFLETAVAGLRRYKETNSLRDYTDMLTEFCTSNIRIPLKMLVVDEAQDLSELQWQVVHKMADDAERVVIAGDDDQAIYIWAGASSDRLVTMEGDVRVLGQSWRVPRSIQSVANGLVNMIARRRPKEWKPREGDDGIVERVFRLDDLDFAGDDIMVLVRNQFVQEQVEDHLRQSGIVFENKYGSSIKKGYLQAMVLWEKLRAGESVTVDEARIVYQQMSSGVGVTRGFKTLPNWQDDELVHIQQLKEHGGLLVDSIWHDALDRIPKRDIAYMLVARQHGERFKKARVRVNTIHTAKGAEARHVILMLEVARRTDREAEIRPDDELRVWYVAVTRAKERLTMVEPTDHGSFRCKWL